MKLNKKADIIGRKQVFYVVAIFVVIAAFFVVFSFISSDKSKISELPSGLENYLIVQRFLNSPICFALQDADTGRAIPSTIDIGKFNEASLNRCYNAQGTNVKAYRLTLSYDDKNIPIRTGNWEGFFTRAETRSVFVFDGAIKKAELLIETQNAK